jgi:uroporphyrin-III C-methyltransferase
MNGFVSLVGAGPGDPELLTVKALRLLRHADVVAYDRLIGQEILTECRADAELIYVGKHGKDCKTTWAQEDINNLLVEKARQGLNIVRLKGGDPFIFGRGGEEALALREANISFEIVPGISSSIAAAAYAGIPVTHRKVATSFAVVAGHEDPTKENSSVNYSSLATAVDTLVVLMGVGNIQSIVAELIVNGRDANTPAAAVSYGTTHKQQTITSSLVDLPKTIELANIQAPAAIIIGEVVRLRDQLAWFVHDISPQLQSEPQTVTAWAGMLE